MEIVINGRRPQKPAVNSPAYLTYGLTDAVWDMMEMCWNREASHRPSAGDLSNLSFLVNVVVDRPVQE
jgi:hypothetical protein